MSQQRKKIFIDMSMFDSKWFYDLTNVHKLAYLFLWRDSDNVGVWKPHIRELEFKLDNDIDPKRLLDDINSESEKIEVLSNGDWWLIEYLPIQVSTLTPNNKPHTSYIEDLRRHGLLNRYASENPDHVNFEIVFKLEMYEEIEDQGERKKAKAAYEYLKSKRLVSPLKEACQTLGRGCQESKEKETDKGKDMRQVKEKATDKKKELDQISVNGHDPNSDLFGDPSL